MTKRRSTMLSVLSRVMRRYKRDVSRHARNRRKHHRRNRDVARAVEQLERVLGMGGSK